MSAVRNGRRAHAAPRSKAPVVLTFDHAQQLVDQVGNLDTLCSEGAATRVLEMLSALLSAGDDGPDAIQSLETDANRYADVHILREPDCVHVVLIDVSQLAMELRARQQSNHEIDLARARQLRQLANGLRDDDADATPTRALHETSNALGLMLQESGAALAQVLGHVRILERSSQGNCAQMRSIAAIQRAALRLETLSAKAALALSEQNAVHDTLDSSSLGMFIEETFALQARMQGIAMRVEVPEPLLPLVVDDARLRQVLASLLAHVLDGFAGERLVVRIGVRERRNLLMVEAISEPVGFALDRVSAFVTASPRDAWRQPEPAVVRGLLRQMGGEVGLDERQDGGCDLWFHVPLQRADAPSAQGKDDAYGSV